MPEPRRNTLRTSQPGKTIWSILALAVGAIRLPIWLLYFAPRFTRPHAKWSLGQAVKVRIVKAFLKWASQVEKKTPMSLEPGAEGPQFVIINPAKSSYYTGVLTQDSEIKPIQIGGTWYPAKPKVIDSSDKVLLHFHGGAFVIGDGRKEDAGFLAKTHLRSADIQHVFCPQYRLASNPGGRFPAAMQDVITSYAYLLNDMGVDPSNIIVGGDSAGGNLALGLVRYLAQHGDATDLPNLKCALLWSPWVDPNAHLRDPGLLATSPHEPTDYLNPDFPVWGAECYAPLATSGISNETEYIKHLGNPFKTDIPLWISTGGKEVLFHDIVQLHDEFQSIGGNRVDLSIEEYAPHDIILVGKKVGFEVEAAAAAKKAGAFIAKL